VSSTRETKWWCRAHCQAHNNLPALYRQPASPRIPKPGHWDKQRPSSWWSFSAMSHIPAKDTRAASLLRAPSASQQRYASHNSFVLHIVCNIILEIGLPLCNCKGNGYGPVQPNWKCHPTTAPPQTQLPGRRGKSPRPACEQSSSRGRGAREYAYTSPSVSFSIANTAATVYSLTVSSHIHAKLGREGAASGPVPPPSTLKKSVSDSCFKVTTFHFCSRNTIPQGFFS